MARIKYYDSDTQQWVYGDMALQPPLPTGTANGDMLVWDNTNQEWVVRHSPRLPNKYQEIEYIENSGTQWLGFNNISVDRIVADFQYLALSTKGEFIINAGALNTDANLGFAGNSTPIWRWFIGTNAGSGSSVDLARHTIDLSTTAQYFDGEIISSYTSNAPSSIALFNSFYNSGLDIPTQARIYSAKGYKDGEIVTCLIPCYDKITSVIGMYDTVNGVFYTNAGSGTFTKGADV